MIKDEGDLPTTTISVGDLPIRLTSERWGHITERHPELSGLRDLVLKAVAEPSRVLDGSDGERLAVRELESGKAVVVVYREGETDGFIVTAFLTRRMKSLERRIQRWP